MKLLQPEDLNSSDFTNDNTLAAGGVKVNTGAGSSVAAAIAAAIVPADGSETKVSAGTNVTVTGTGTTADPYVVNSSGGTPDGSETKVQGSGIATVTGTGTTADPYIVAVLPESVQYGATTSVTDEFGNTTVTPADPATQFVGTPVAGDEFFETVDGTQATSVLNQWIYDGAAWTQRRNHAVYTGTDDPIAMAVSGLPGDIYIRTSATGSMGYPNAYGREEYLYVQNTGWRLTSRDPGFQVSMDSPSPQDNDAYLGSLQFNNDASNLVVPGSRAVLLSNSISGVPGAPMRHKSYVFDDSLSGENYGWRLDSYDPYVFWGSGVGSFSSSNYDVVVGDIGFATMDGTQDTPVTSMFVFTGLANNTAGWKRVQSTNCIEVANVAEVVTLWDSGSYSTGSLFLTQSGNSATGAWIYSANGNGQPIQLPLAKVIIESSFSNPASTVGAMLVVTDTGDDTGTVTEAYLAVSQAPGSTNWKKLPTTTLSGNLIVDNGGGSYSVNLYTQATGNITISGTGNQPWDPLTFDVPVPDGSETKVSAGTNVTVTGTGTTADPYVVNGAAASDASRTVAGIANLTDGQALGIGNKDVGGVRIGLNSTDANYGKGVYIGPADVAYGNSVPDSSVVLGANNFAIGGATNSFVAGDTAIAYAANSVAISGTVLGTGVGGVAIGGGNFDPSRAEGQYSTAIGPGSRAVGNQSVAIGGGRAEGLDSVAIGGIGGPSAKARATGQNSIAIGPALASGAFAFGFGDSGTIASGNNSVACQNSTAAGQYSFAMMQGIANADYSATVGGVVDAAHNGTFSVFATTTMANQIYLGGGSVLEVRSDAPFYGAAFNTVSDARMKRDVEELDLVAAEAFLKALRFVNYNKIQNQVKLDADHARKVEQAQADHDREQDAAKKAALFAALNTLKQNPPLAKVTHREVGLIAQEVAVVAAAHGFGWVVKEDVEGFFALDYDSINNIATAVMISKL